MDADNFSIAIPDAKDVRARISAFEWQQKYFKISKVTWNKTQLAFMNQTAKFAYNRAANQSGKSYSVGGLISYVATGRFPSTYQGWRPKLRTDGAYSVVIWVLSTTGQMIRDGLQTILLGDVASGDSGTGLLPKDSIISIQAARGIAGAVDYCTIRRDDGTTAKIAFKTYEQGRAAIQAEPVSLVVCDELLDDLSMWNELIARTTTTGGILRLTATERLQSSPVALWFRDNAGPDVVTFSMSLDDADHLSREEKDAIKASYKSEAELNTRYYGLPFQGAGSVFDTNPSEIAERIDPSQFPPWYKYLIAVDFSHFGRSDTASKFAAVFAAIDPQTQVVRIYDCFKMRGIPEQHVARIFAGGGRGIRVAWPHDGYQGEADGSNLMLLYKKAGLTMLPSHAEFPNHGGYNFESGIEALDHALVTGKLKVASHLTPWFDEYGAYERGEDGKVIKRMDDLMSATRQLVMAQRFAQPFGSSSDDRKQSQQLAKGLDFLEDKAYGGYN